MKNPPVPQPEQNREWTRIDANNRALSRRGFCSRSFAFIRGSIRFSCGLAAAAFLPFAALAADSPSVLLQKGIYAEETEGNVDAAIKIYEQIAAEAATNRSFVAQAQYRLAVCYQKKGNKEQAIKLLNELAQQFPSDAALSKKARDTLAGLGAPLAPAISVRKLPVTFPTRWFMSISSDGRFVSYQTISGSDLAVGEVATGKSWTVAKGTEEQQPWGEAVFSPDGQHLAYDLAGAAIYVSKNDGTETRKLFERKGAKDEVYALVWSADGSQVMARSWIAEGDTYQAFVLDAKTGARKEIPLPKTDENPSRLNEGQIEWVSAAPDLSCVALKYRNYPNRITLLDLKSRQEVTVVDRDGDRLFGWAPENAKLLFSKSSSSGVDLWAIDVKDGKPLGQPELLRNNLGRSFPVGITSDGSIYFAIGENKPNPFELWVMEGFLANKPHVEPWRLATDIPTNEFVFGPNNSIRERTLDLSATTPAGWIVRSATRAPDSINATIEFVSAEIQGVSLRLAYYGNRPNAPAVTDVDAWLRQSADVRIPGALTNAGVLEFANRRDSFTAGTVDGRKALSWTADFKRGTYQRVRHFTLVHTRNGQLMIHAEAPPDKIDAIIPAFKSLLDSVHLGQP